ncbi:MAG: type II toxin-antitoxin system HicA family toxin [Clostridiales Family XIII bacterium]|jgi:predicted RNA binding protein YcfA (HicA-like mRNA interferase family)|nr:type II toxin-antitoxin system HicA family toxin [Clostridiales Family XIII bacterium]
MNENAKLRKELLKAGWVIKPGHAHDQATHPEKPGIKIPLPRHRKDMPKGTAESIRKAAGLAKKKKGGN